jgi:predicted porin
VDWKIKPWVKLGVSYHYERGLAEGRNEPQFKDDVSYINHYISADLDFDLTERLALLTALHYEINIWTSNIVGDERNGAHENVYQGEAILTYRLTQSMRAFAGVQRSNRKESFETEGAKNTNVGIGLNFAF